MASLWADMAHQNMILRFALLSLTMISLGLALALTKVSLKEPLVIERACSSLDAGTARKSASSREPSREELRDFALRAVSMRFNLREPISTTWFSDEQLRLRRSELDELAKKKLEQSVYIDSVVVTNDGATAEGVRILALGKSRTAIPIILNLKIERTSRSPLNPYGLVLTKIASSKLAQGQSPMNGVQP